MKWEDFEEGIIALDPAERPWEYDGDGIQIYKLECGFTGKTLWDGGYALWLKQYGSEWDDKR